MGHFFLPRDAVRKRSTVLVVGRCPSVRLSVCHGRVLCQAAEDIIKLSLDPIMPVSVVHPALHNSK